MKMKLAIAVALSHHPKLLILDEATSGLGPMVRDDILEVFNDFTRNENHSILLSSHIISDLEKICDYIAFLHKGKLVLFEEKDALVIKDQVNDAFAQERITLEDIILFRFGAQKGRFIFIAFIGISVAAGTIIKDITPEIPVNIVNLLPVLTIITVLIHNIISVFISLHIKQP